MGTEWYGGRQEKKHGEQQKADTLRTYPYLSVLLRTSPYFSVLKKAEKTSDSLLTNIDCMLNCDPVAADSGCVA